MENIKIGDKLEIHCYKHNGKIDRVCDEAMILDVTDDYIVCGNYKYKYLLLNQFDARKHQAWQHF